MAKTPKNNIRTIQDLDQAIYQLQQEAKNLEKTMDTNLDYLQDNFKRMAWNSIIHQPNGKGLSHGLIQTLFNHETLQAVVARLLAFLADKASDGLESLLNKFNRKKESNA